MKLDLFPRKLWAKSISATIIIISIFGLINIYVNRQFSSKVLQEELAEKGLFAGKILSERITDLLLYDDLISLQRVLDDAQENNVDIVYAFVVDGQNQVVVHTFGQNFPIALLPRNAQKENEESSFQWIEDEHGNLYRDMSFPLLDRRLGFLHLGLAEKHLDAILAKVTAIQTTMVLGFLFVGIALSILFSYWITNPIAKVTKAFESINLDDEFHPVQVKTKDEISTLANKFNEMAFRLQKAHSDLKRAQKSLVRAEKLASIGTLASGLTHEISNPLAGLKNCLFRIKKRPRETTINRYFSLMMSAVQKIERVVLRLLDFSRRDVFKFEPFLLHQSIDRALSLAEYKLEMNRIHVIRKYDGRLKVIQGDSQQMEQVIVNLVLNAVDAMPLEGKLFISTGLNDSTVNIEIEDTGEGIAPENIDKVFDPFYTTKEPGKGTGLGLSVSYNIIKEHGGDISVESQMKRGTKFVIKLPLTRGAGKL